MQSENTVIPDTDGIVTREHYRTHPSGIEPLAVIKYETFLRGNILKYVWRAPYKGNELADLIKARDYLDLEISRVKNGY